MDFFKPCEEITTHDISGSTLQHWDIFHYETSLKIGFDCFRAPNREHRVTRWTLLSVEKLTNWCSQSLCTFCAVSVMLRIHNIFQLEQNKVLVSCLHVCPPQTSHTATYVSQLPITIEMGAQFPAVRPVADLVSALAVRCMHLCWMNLPRVTPSQHVFSLQGEKKTLAKSGLAVTKLAVQWNVYLKRRRKGATNPEKGST